jgi:predicted nuclease of predicted toxin-antitoxin system
MRILIDECVDPRVKLLFSDHERATVHEKGWDALEDGPLLALAVKEFDVLVTIDRGLEFQQNIPKFKIGVIIVHVPKNQLAHYRALQKELLLAVEKIQSGQVIHTRTPPA